MEYAPRAEIFAPNWELIKTLLVNLCNDDDYDDNINNNSNGSCGTFRFLLCTPPGRRPGIGIGGERERLGGGHSIFVLTHDLPISGPEKKLIN